MPFLMIRNDITKVSADAVVNPANERLLEGSGTSRAIFAAAGEEKLQQACARIGRCEVGHAVVTKAFELPARYIIHAVGPIWQGGSCQEESLLYHTYIEALELAAKKRCRSVACPLLSAGSYGYPKDQAMRVAVEAITAFLMKHEMMVYMVLYDREVVHISHALFLAVEEYIDDHYVEEHDETCADERRGNRPGMFEQGEHTSMLTPEIHPNRFVSPIPPEAVPESKRQHSYVLRSKRSLESLVAQLDETFSSMLLRLIDERALKDSVVYKKANIDRRHFSKIRKDKNYTPTKKTVLAFAIALELSLDESIDLMQKAGYAFSKSSKFDVIIRFFIENHNYNIFEINEVLFTYDQPILGE